MNSAEIEKRIEALTYILPRPYKKYADCLLDSQYSSQVDAYMAAYKCQKKNANNRAARVAADPRVKEYVELNRQLAQRRALEALEYDETQWLWDTVQAMNMALGRADMVKTVEIEKLVDTSDENGRVIKQEMVIERTEVFYKKTNLNAAKGFSELLGKRLQLFTERHLIGEDAKNPLNSLRQLAETMGAIAIEAQQKGPIRNDSDG